MEQEIREIFEFPERDIRQIPVLSLAFLGDAVYELGIRTWLLESSGQRPGEMSRKKNQLVNAQFQAKLARWIIKQEILTEDEENIFRRGRNASPPTMAKRTSIQDYHAATGLECVMGYLYLTGQEKRIAEIIKLAAEFSETQQTC